MVLHNLYVKAIPRMALKSKGLLYSVLATAMLYQISTDGDETEANPSTLKSHDLYYLYV